MRKIHIFKTGEQISSTGYKRVFTELDIQSMVDSFDLKVHEPPIRVGHEDNDKTPSFGWVKKLEKEGGNLYAHVQFTPEMEDMIKNGHYKKVSASFYSPSSEVNPKQGYYTLKHVALLGATPPAVKGLEPFGFSEELMTMTMEIEINMSEEILTPVEFEEEEEAKEKKKNVKGSKAEVEEEEEGEEEEEEEGEEEEVLSKEKYKAKKRGVKGYKAEEEEVLSKEKYTKMASQFLEAQNRLKYLEEQFSELEAAKAKAEELLREEKRSRRREVLTSKVRFLYSEGKITEGIYPQTDLLEFAVGLEEGTLEFREGESSADMLIEILSRVPAPVDFSELVSDTEAPEESEEIDFSQKVERYALENNISFEKALRALSYMGK